MMSDTGIRLKRKDQLVLPYWHWEMSVAEGSAHGEKRRFMVGVCEGKKGNFRKYSRKLF